MLRLGRFSFLVIGFAASVAPAWSAQLLSIGNLDLAANEYIMGFEVRALNGSVSAVCRVPLDWSITAANSIMESDLSGGAGHGASGVNRESVDKLQALFLLDEPNAAAGGKTKFEGRVFVEFYGAVQDSEIRPLLSHHFIVQQAARCP